MLKYSATLQSDLVAVECLLNECEKFTCKSITHYPGRLVAHCVADPHKVTIMVWRRLLVIHALKTNIPWIKTWLYDLFPTAEFTKSSSGSWYEYPPHLFPNIINNALSDKDCQLIYDTTISTGARLIYRDCTIHATVAGKLQLCTKRHFTRSVQRLFESLLKG